VGHRRRELVVLANAMHSDFGHALRAIHSDQTAAPALGIDVPRYNSTPF
jgi:ABC-type branched-subunit amino acid transport system permease subunit